MFNRCDSEKECAMRRIYDWTMAQAGGQHALLVLALVSFIEASIFPIPPDVLMIPMILAAPSRAWLIALVATLSSVLGGLLGYGIGFFFFETLGQPILEFFGKADKMVEFNATFNGAGFWAVLIAGVTPFPFKVITIMSGWTAMPLATFLTTALIARAIRFFVVAGLLYAFGAPIRDFIERYLGLVFTAFVALLVGGFLLLRYI
jgi:membrane protein YqaA with SNARE-associated domain